MLVYLRLGGIFGGEELRKSFSDILGLRAGEFLLISDQMDASNDLELTIPIVAVCYDCYNFIIHDDDGRKRIKDLQL